MDDGALAAGLDAPCRVCRLLLVALGICYCLQFDCPFRFVRYFEDIVLRAWQPASEAVMLTMLKLNGLPRFALSRGEKGCAPVFDMYVLGREAELIFSSTEIAPDVRYVPVL